jgi:hypothetical protein
VTSSRSAATSAEGKGPQHRVDWAKRWYPIRTQGVAGESATLRSELELRAPPQREVRETGHRCGRLSPTFSSLKRNQRFEERGVT